MTIRRLLTVPLACLVLMLCCRILPVGRKEAPTKPNGSIILAGRAFPIARPVIHWFDPGGFNAYLQHCTHDPTRVLPTRPATGCNTPRRYGVRDFLITREAPAAGTLHRLRRNISQIVLHYDASGSSERCFRVLHDERGLSAHFLVDRDGTIYQTLDVRERARHAGSANDRSVGIEIANIGAYPTREQLRAKQSVISRLTGRPQPLSQTIIGTVQGRRLVQPPFTDAQYAATADLLAALIHALPRIEPTVPRDRSGEIYTRVLDEQHQSRFAGILGHYHLSKVKRDPGPAFDWKRLMRLLNRARPFHHPSTRARTDTSPPLGRAGRP